MAIVLSKSQAAPVIHYARGSCGSAACGGGRPARGRRAPRLGRVTLPSCGLACVARTPASITHACASRAVRHVRNCTCCPSFEIPKTNAKVCTSLLPHNVQPGATSDTEIILATLSASLADAAASDTVSMQPTDASSNAQSSPSVSRELHATGQAGPQGR